MNQEDRLLGLHEMMKIATKTDALARQVCEKSKADRITGRLARDPHDIRAISHITVEFAKKGGAISAAITQDQRSWVLFQISMEEVSHAVWEQLWNDAHPDRFGEWWDGEDSALMSVWRERVRTMIRECHQEAILEMSTEEYFARLTTACENEEVAEDLANWISLIHEEDTPST